MMRPAIPAGYVMKRERGAIVVALPSVIADVCAAIHRAGSLYAAAADQPDAAAFVGRGATYRMQTPHGAWVVRHYRRGGGVAKVLTDEYARVGVPRPLRELRASVAARARGVATPEVIASIIYPHGLVYRGDIATHYIPDSRDLADVTISTQRADSETRLHAWRVAGTLLRTAFAQGVAHADLNLRNILIAQDGAHLLDLDKAVIRRGAVSGAARHAMLDRFHRSRRKLEAAAHYHVPAEELAVFDAAWRDS